MWPPIIPAPGCRYATCRSIATRSWLRSPICLMTKPAFCFSSHLRTRFILPGCAATKSCHRRTFDTLQLDSGVLLVSAEESAWNERRVFCISMQRTGTTSVGKFLRDVGYRWAGWPADERNDWTNSWYQGDFERIFGSSDFKSANAFEDFPWRSPEFYRAHFHCFPGSRFILFQRDPEE